MRKIDFESGGPAGRSVEGRPWLHLNGIIISGLLVALIMFVLYLGQVKLLMMLAGAILLAALTYYQPAPLFLALLILSTDVFKLVDLENLPYVPLGSAGRLNAQDLALGLMLGIALIKLAQRRERPLFTGPFFLMAAMVLAAFLLGLLAGTITVNSGLNGLRSLATFIFYFALVGTIDSPRKLRQVVWIVFIVALVSVGLQLYEFASGARLTTATSVRHKYFATTMLIDVDGTVLPYLWNRAVGYLFVAFFLALGVALRKRSIVYAVLAGIFSVGFVVAFMREWYVYILCGLFAVLITPREYRIRAILGLALVLTLIGGVFLALESGVLGTKFPFLDTWVARVSTIGHFDRESNFLSRVTVVKYELNLWRESPWFGYGPGTLEDLMRNGPRHYSDVGMTNTLLEYGVFGWASIMILVIVVARQGAALVRKLQPSLEQGYISGLVGAWVGVVVAYFTMLNGFTSTAFSLTAGLIMGLTDRLVSFHNQETEQSIEYHE